MNDRNLLDSQDWTNLIGKSGKLIAYAAMRIRDDYSSLLVRGLTVRMLAEDVAQETILRVYDGRRNWNQEAYPNFDDFLYGVVDSILSYNYKSQSEPEEELSEDTTEYEPERN